MLTSCHGIVARTRIASTNARPSLAVETSSSPERRASFHSVPAMTSWTIATRGKQREARLPRDTESLGVRRLTLMSAHLRHHGERFLGAMGYGTIHPLAFLRVPMMRFRDENKSLERRKHRAMQGSVIGVAKHPSRGALCSFYSSKSAVLRELLSVPPGPCGFLSITID
jgi:hypothetical protein